MSNENNILLLTLEYPPQKGGIATYLESEVIEEKIQVDIVMGKNHFWKFWPQWFPLIWQVSHSYKMVWVSHILPVGYVVLVWKKLFNVKYRLYLHGLDLLRPKKSIWKRFWVSVILNNATEIICNSKATFELLKHYNINGHRLVDRLRIRHPRIKKIDINKYKDTGSLLRKKYKINDKPVLLTIARLVKRKGIDLVISSLPEVWKHIPDLVYVVLGDGEESVNLGVIASEVQQSYGRTDKITSSLVYARHSKDNDNRIIFTGIVSEEEKYAWLSACNMFILTPRNDQNDFEGYGIVYKEAQMFRKPVIGSRVGGVPEAVGTDGTLIKSSSTKEISQAIIKHAST